MPEKDGESTTAVVREISAKAGVPLSETDISTSHRVGRPQSSKPRPIVARFVRRDTRTTLLLPNLLFGISEMERNPFRVLPETLSGKETTLLITSSVGCLETYLDLGLCLGDHCLGQFR